MPDQVYDTIAREYRESKRLPFRKHVEEHTLFRLLGDPRGRSVLDLACGEGIWTREIRRRGAARVVGVDISPAMVELAREQEARDGLGCEYYVGDAAAVLESGVFDVVVGSYLLNYARTEREILAFCLAIRAALKPGGRFVGFNDNPANSPERYPTYRPYGFEKSTTPERREGDPVRYTLHNPDGTRVSFDNYYLSPMTYVGAFARAGFSSFSWRGPWVSDEGKAAFPRGYWDDFLADPPLIGMEAAW